MPDTVLGLCHHDIQRQVVLLLALILKTDHLASTAQGEQLGVEVEESGILRLCTVWVERSVKGSAFHS